MPNREKCNGCEINCATCLINGEHNRNIPYPLRTSRDERSNPSTYKNWTEKHKAIIRAYARQYFNPDDWNFQYNWMMDRPRVAFDMVNDDGLPNQVKIAKTLHFLIETRYGLTLIVGTMDSGKSWTFLWLAECMHKYGPDKKIYYVGDESMKVPPWMEIVQSYRQAENDSWICLDEASAKAQAKDAMMNVNKYLTTLASRVAHRDIHLFFIAQHPHLIEKNLRRLALSIIMKPMTFLEDEGGIWRDLQPYFPERVDHTGFYSTQSQVAHVFYQPAPLSPYRDEFTKMFRDDDIKDRGQSLFEEEDEEEEEGGGKETGGKLDPKHIRIYKYLEDHTEREAAEEFDMSRSGVRYAKERYEKLVGSEEES